MNNNWLLSLSAGDKVITVRGIRPHEPRVYGLGIVAKTTKKTIVLEDGSRYQREDGRRLNADYWGMIVEPTDELRKQVKSPDGGTLESGRIYEGHGVVDETGELQFETTSQFASSAKVKATMRNFSPWENLEARGYTVKPVRIQVMEASS